MRKYRDIMQRNFDDNYNGYYQWYDGDFHSRNSGNRIGAYYTNYNLLDVVYYINYAIYYVT